MRLVPNWRRVLRRAYSVHFNLIAFVLGILGAVSEVWPLFDGLLPIPQLLFGILGLVFAMVGLAGRFIEQPSVSGGGNGG